PVHQQPHQATPFIGFKLSGVDTQTQNQTTSHYPQPTPSPSPTTTSHAIITQPFPTPPSSTYPTVRHLLYPHPLSPAPISHRLLPLTSAGTPVPVPPRPRAPTPPAAHAPTRPRPYAPATSLDLWLSGLLVGWASAAFWSA